MSPVRVLPMSPVYTLRAPSNLETLPQPNDSDDGKGLGLGGNGTPMVVTPITIGEHSRVNGFALRWECGGRGATALPSGTISCGAARLESAPYRRGYAAAKWDAMS